MEFVTISTTDKYHQSTRMVGTGREAGKICIVLKRGETDQGGTICGQKYGARIHVHFSSLVMGYCCQPSYTSGARIDEVAYLTKC